MKLTDEQQQAVNLAVKGHGLLLNRKENLLERIRVKAMQTDWMDKLKQALSEELNA